jgi:hypothetical protein
VPSARITRSISKRASTGGNKPYKRTAEQAALLPRVSFTKRQDSPSPTPSLVEKLSQSDSEYLLLRQSKPKSNRLLVDTSEEPLSLSPVTDTDDTPRGNLPGDRFIRANSLLRIFEDEQEVAPATSGSDADISLHSPPSENALQLNVGWPTTTWGDDSTRVQSPQPAWPLPPILDSWPTPVNVPRPIHDDFFLRNDNVGWIGQEPTGAGTSYILGNAENHISAYQLNRPTYLREITYVSQDCRWLAGQVEWIHNTKAEIYEIHRKRVEELKSLRRDSHAIVEAHNALCHWIEGFEALTQQWLGVFVDVIERHKIIEGLDVQRELNTAKVEDLFLLGNSITKYNRPFLPLIWKV